jgi:hypothetical protein
MTAMDSSVSENQLMPMWSGHVALGRVAWPRTGAVVWPARRRAGATRRRPARLHRRTDRSHRNSVRTAALGVERRGERRGCHCECTDPDQPQHATAYEVHDLPPVTMSTARPLEPSIRHLCGGVKVIACLSADEAVGPCCTATGQFNLNAALSRDLTASSVAWVEVAE